MIDVSGGPNIEIKLLSVREVQRGGQHMVMLHFVQVPAAA